MTLSIFIFEDKETFFAYYRAKDKDKDKDNGKKSKKNKHKRRKAEAAATADEGSRAKGDSADAAPGATQSLTCELCSRHSTDKDGSSQVIISWCDCGHKIQFSVVLEKKYQSCGHDHDKTYVNLFIQWCLLSSFLRSFFQAAIHNFV